MPTYQIIVIGAGAGGLVVAIGAAKAGKKVLLIENGNYGGDCTNFGCIPSKALIASSHTAQALDRAKEMGIELKLDGMNAKGALLRAQKIVQGIRKEEEPEALAKHGVETLTGMATFVDPYTLEVTFSGGQKQRVEGKQIVIATGSQPISPSIPGLEEACHYTNETIFSLAEIPEQLLVIGGGPIGCELSQAFHRLGAQVTLVQHDVNLLKREEPESQTLIEHIFRNEGINLFVDHEPTQIKQTENKVVVTANKHVNFEGTHLLIAAGRRPAIEHLNLEAAKVRTHPRGIDVNCYGQTSQKHIWAVGDVTGQSPFTHMAEMVGRQILFNLLLPWPFRKKAPHLVPRVTFTDPEIAAIGLTEAVAKTVYGESKIATYFFPFSKLDRAITTGRTEGFVKVITKKWSSRILGATIASPRAGEMLLEIATAMHANVPLRKLANVIHPYPTYSLAIRKAADLWFTQTILGALKRK